MDLSSKTEVFIWSLVGSGIFMYGLGTLIQALEKLHWIQKVYFVYVVVITTLDPGALNRAPGFFFAQNFSGNFLCDISFEHSLRSPKVKTHNPLLWVIRMRYGEKSMLNQWVSYVSQMTHITIA